MVKYLYIKKLFNLMDGIYLTLVSRRRANIDLLIHQTRVKANLRGRKIETIDPLVACAKRLFPYLSDHMILEYARTALRVIQNESQTEASTNHQTTLLTDFPIQ